MYKRESIAASIAGIINSCVCLLCNNKTHNALTKENKAMKMWVSDVDFERHDNQKDGKG